MDHLVYSTLEAPELNNQGKEPRTWSLVDAQKVAGLISRWADRLQMFLSKQ